MVIQSFRKYLPSASCAWSSSGLQGCNTNSAHQAHGCRGAPLQWVRKKVTGKESNKVKRGVSRARKKDGRGVWRGWWMGFAGSGRAEARLTRRSHLPGELEGHSRQGGSRGKPRKVASVAAHARGGGQGPGHLGRAGKECGIARGTSAVLSYASTCALPAHHCAFGLSFQPLLPAAPPPGGAGCPGQLEMSSGLLAVPCDIISLVGVGPLGSCPSLASSPGSCQPPA